MRILVACEFSGIVREAFTREGHDAWSCDLLPTEIPGQHIQDDVLKHLGDDWDLMIAFPPCTHLSKAGGWCWKYKKVEQREAFNFVLKLWSTPIEKICIENPVGWLNTHWNKPNQMIHPWQFGEPWTKQTCLWLKGLPVLIPTNIVEPTGNWVKPGNIRKRRFNEIPEGGNRNPKDRSRFFSGIADAMAEQWGNR